MKKVSAKKIITLVLWIIGLSGLLMTLAFVGRKESHVKVEHLSVNVSNTDANSFIDEEDVKQFFSERKDSILNVESKNIDIYKLEKVLNAHPAVENAEIAKDINGDVSIQVKQRTPLVRVFAANGESYYIDTQSKLMPLSDKYTARVLVATGYIFEPYSKRYQMSVKEMLTNESLKNSSVLDDIYILSDFISKDTLLINLIQQINVTSDKEIELYPSVGGQKIVFGGVKDIEEKFEKLKIFYVQGLNRTDAWQKYSTINIKYKNQVVCTKK